MTVRMEHANLCVRDIDAMIRFLTTAFPEFRVRADHTDEDGSRWVHVGNDDTYLALSSAWETGDRSFEPYCGLPGVNHLGYEVDDADALRQRMLAAGFEESTVPNSHPHRQRVYFLDPEGNDWEFVQYFSTDPAERNDYELVASADRRGRIRSWKASKNTTSKNFLTSFIARRFARRGA